jgi:hypothetical protein
VIELPHPRSQEHERQWPALTPVTAHGAEDWRELATRANDGLEVSLHWSGSTDRVRITVFDQRLDESCDIHVDGADALSAFEHPFAYVGSRSVPDGAERPSLDLRQQAAERS